MRNNDIFESYENGKLLSTREYAESHPKSTVPYSALCRSDVSGLPVIVERNESGELDVTFISDSHVLAIGATRSGKTTGYVIPTINVLLNLKSRPSMVISDPKQELYISNAEKFKRRGYRVILLDFTNYKHSDCWNPLTKYYRLYKKYLDVDKSVKIIDDRRGKRFRFNGETFRDIETLNRSICEVKDGYLDEVEKGITSITAAVIPTLNTNDPYWEDSARDLLRAILYGMLEDIGRDIITEDTFSFDTVLRIFDGFTDKETDYDGGYFRNRPKDTSKAYALASKCIIEQAPNTRRCISSSFVAKMNKFRDTSVRRITCTNTFEMSELDDDKPTVIFVSYRDEESLHYDVISMFLTNLYTELIAVARGKSSKLERPFYFILDEFGNLPKFNDFDKVISACGGRNIWFVLILQSYAQLYHIYGKETAEIIKDNLNTHIFFGTNNPETKREFSEECGRKTVIAPTSALNGSGESIERYEKDTVALVPVSRLTKIPPCECIVTQMREDVLWSRIERSYLCPEFNSKHSDPKRRKIQVDFSDPKYVYVKPGLHSQKRQSSSYDY